MVAKGSFKVRGRKGSNRKGSRAWGAFPSANKKKKKKKTGSSHEEEGKKRNEPTPA